MFSTMLLRIGIAAGSAAILISLLTGSERRLQAGAGVALLGVIVAIALFDMVVRRFQISNIKYFILASYAIFLGLGMLLDLGDPTYFFSRSAIALALGGLMCFLAGF